MTISADEVLLKPASWFENLSWEQVFEIKQKDPLIHVDLGAGDGGFIVARAKNQPETHFLAVERLLGRVRKIGRRTIRKSLQNVRVLRIESSYAVQYLFPPNSIHCITVLFPDPWPKRRHHKNRVIQIPFLEQCARCLKPDGWLGIKTDDLPYFEYIQKTLKACKALEVWPEADPAQLLKETTDFEDDFIKTGRAIHFIAAKRKLC